jgi:hypothetical protein
VTRLRRPGLRGHHTSSAPLPHSGRASSTRWPCGVTVNCQWLAGGVTELSHPHPVIEPDESFWVSGAGDQLLCRSQSNKDRMCAIATASQTEELDARGFRHRACGLGRRSGYHGRVGIWRGATHLSAATRTHAGESTRQSALMSNQRSAPCLVHRFRFTAHLR